MKKTFGAVALSAAALTLSATAHGQSLNSASATGSTTIIRPITINKSADLTFGRIVKPSSGTGTVAIASTSDSVTAGSGAVALSGITTSRAKFTIGGEGAQAISVTVPAQFEMVKGADTIAVALNPDLGTTTTLSGALAAAGSVSLNVGGSFSVPVDTPTGAYSGSFTVTVAYQ